ncbi:MAG: glycosyltransferase, partial [Gammaproteobacteria bacterium]|nr:glycosyltransferase [Gammaproteobacteria bacterium]
MSVTEKKINVLHLRDSPWVDGPGRTIHESAAAIDNNRFNYIIGAFEGVSDEQSPFISEALKRNLNVITIQEKGAFDLSTFRQILKYIDDHDVHILHTHEFRSDLIGLICAKIKRIHVITTVHGFISNNFKGKLYTFANKLLLRFFCRVIVVSGKMKSQLEHLYVSSKKIEVLYNALVIERYKVDWQLKNFRNELGVGDDVCLIANIGRLSPEKGQRDFLTAAAKVASKNTNAIYLLIGIGPEENNLRNYVSELGLEDAVRFLGYRKDMIDIYNGLNLVVQSSYTEGMPNVILESLIMSVPVLASDVGGTREAVEGHASSKLFTPGDIDFLVSAINQFMEERDKYQKLAILG